jgi:signal transduction histidine kinase
MMVVKEKGLVETSSSAGGTEKVNFRFSTNIIRRLGEELNPSPSQGLIELVKNSYDADALKCTIELFDTSKPGGKILISDDGIGMDADYIKNGWLVLGRSPKIKEEITKLGRIPSGNKGLGRLAALRMGTSTSLTSIPRSNAFIENTIEIDWDRFENADLVDDVDLEIVRQRYPSEKSSGTVIMLENLRSSLSHTDVKKLAKEMILLADPFEDNPIGFKPILKAPEYEDLEKMVAAKYFGDAEFHLIARLDKEGLARASVQDWRGNELYVGSHKDLRRRAAEEPYICPTAKFELWIFILDSPTFSTRSSSIGEVRKWLNEFGGVHLYYNGLRVSPYGDSGNDWLEMNLMRARSPEVRPSTNTSMGRIVVSDESVVLVQKTDRSGFIVNDAFIELKNFAVDALNWVAKCRLEEAEKKRSKARAEAPQRSIKEKEAIEQAISYAPKDIRDGLQNAFLKYNKARDNEVNELRKEVQLYRTLSTVGITSAVFAHESANNPLKLIIQSINTIKSRAAEYLGDYYMDKLEKPINRIIHSAESLRVLANVTLSLVDHEKRRLGRVNIHQVIKEIIELYDPFLKDRHTNITTEFAQGNPYLRGSVAAVESIISNLLNNSLVAFEEREPGDRKIIIRTMVFTESLELRVLDNGIGITGINKKDIWLPGQTTRKNGTGLGLTVVKDTVTDLGGSVDAIEKGELGGAEIIIELPILGV